MVGDIGNLVNVDLDTANQTMRNIIYFLQHNKPAALATIFAIPLAYGSAIIRLTERYDSQMNRVADGVLRGIDSINDAAINLKKHLKDRYQANSRTEK